MKKTTLLIQNRTMTLNEIIETLKAEILVNSNENFTDIEWACATDLMSEVLYYSRSNSILITTLAKPQTVLTADVSEIKVIVFTMSKVPDKKTLEMAAEKNITILITPLSMFSACGKLYEMGVRFCAATSEQEINKR